MDTKCGNAVRQWMKCNLQIWYEDKLPQMAGHIYQFKTEIATQLNIPYSKVAVLSLIDWNAPGTRSPGTAKALTQQVAALNDQDCNIHGLQ